MRYIFLILCLAGCGRAETDLVVFVAASAESVVRELATSFEEQEGIRVLVHAGGSTRLRGQILRGAPADLYLAAGPVHLPGSPEVVALNRMVAVVPISRGEVDWRNAQKVALADPDLAPAGVYARRILDKEGVKAEWIYGGHVRAVLAYVELDLVDVGLVYRTDVSDRVRVVASFAEPVPYQAVVVSDRMGAKKFLSFLVEKRSVFQKRGFE